MSTAMNCITDQHIEHKRNVIITKEEQMIIDTIFYCISQLCVTKEYVLFPQPIIEIIILYSRSYIDLRLTKNKDDDPPKQTKIIIDATINQNTINFIIETSASCLLYPPISDYDNGFIKKIQCGIQSLHSFRSASLVLQHLTLAEDSSTLSIPSSPNSIRYDPDGEIVNYNANIRPRLDRFAINDIISFEITFDEKTIEYFKNGKSILKSSIKFDYPWYMAIWDHGYLNNSKIKIIQDESELNELRKRTK
eukprot:302667_1